jgi:uncharacterized protein (TIGR02271 family)
MFSTTDVQTLRDSNVLDSDGDKIGSVEEIYLDQETEKPEWAAVKTGLFGPKLTMIPLAEADKAGEDIRVPYAKAQVKDAPQVDADGELTQDEEARLYDHYGLDYGEARSDSGLPQGQTAAPGNGQGHVGRDTSGSTTDDAMTRSEEELRVGTTQQERGRVRLKKHVVTENVTQTVPVSREEVRLETEPITDANVGAATSGPEISEEEHEVVLHEERPVVEKETVAKERVRLGKDTVTGEEQVSDEVRKERIETDGDVAAGERR